MLCLEVQRGWTKQSYTIAGTKTRLFKAHYNEIITKVLLDTYND